MQNVMSFVTHDGRLVAGLDIDPGNFNNPVVIDEINNYCLEHPELSEMDIRPFLLAMLSSSILRILLVKIVFMIV